MRRALSILVLTVGLLTLGQALAATTEPPTGSVSISLSTERADYGDRVQVFGSAQPAVPGQEVLIELSTGGPWAEIGRTVTDATGAFSVELVVTTAGDLRAHILESGAMSPMTPLAVTPIVKVKPVRGIAFARATVTARVTPRSYTGRAALILKRGGEVVARTRATVRQGRLRTTVRTPGIGRFFLEIRLPAAAGLSETAAGAGVVARGRELSAGSTGPDVRALIQRLAALRFHVPGVSATFSSYLTDSVIAFQKAYGLPRTGVVEPGTWRKLGNATVLKPRYRAPAPHIEVDKTRQILMVVDDGAVQAVLPVSTGATGNTPEGRHAIRWKAPATTTWLGSGILYRTLTFYGNSFAIHGWYSVPTYPASHGCVRIPIWTADWLYNQSPVGETVYVYH
jgi:lipoprotein-anchoring transpeptidase ErfK/SrfK